jgi:hypothetical protein
MTSAAATGCSRKPNSASAVVRTKLGPIFVFIIVSPPKLTDFELHLTEQQINQITGIRAAITDRSPSLAGPLSSNASAYDWSNNN